MLKFKETKSKEIKIIDLIPGQVFKYANRKYSFVRIKRGGKSMVITDILTEKDYSLKIHDILSSKQIIGKVTLTSKSIKETTSNKNKISIKDVKLKGLNDCNTIRIFSLILERKKFLINLSTVT